MGQTAIPGFEHEVIDTASGGIAVDVGGSGPPVLLLHGFPETRAMWVGVAPVLARHHTVVCADLPGYGDSAVPPDDEHHSPFSKRSMAQAMLDAMSALGHPRFAVAGHDRGGRVAYRAALDHPAAISALAVLDVLPVDVVWSLADERFALAFWPWSLLAQPAPLPERLIAADPDAVIDQALSAEWGTPSSVFPADARIRYAAQLRDPARAHAICEEYRAAADIDRRHDRADVAAGRTIGCPTLVLWSGAGPLGQWYRDRGGPLALWRELAPGATGHGVDGGHFFPEEHPQRTADALATCFAAAR